MQLPPCLLCSKGASAPWILAAGSQLQPLLRCRPSHCLPPPPPPNLPLLQQMAEGRGGAQGQKYRISLGLPVGAVSACHWRQARAHASAQPG